MGNEKYSPEIVKQVKLCVTRYIPGEAATPSIQEYDLPVSAGMTVLDGLLWVKEHPDPTLSFRYSCRMGICGSCGMYINGLPRLACQTQILPLNSSTVVVKPLPNFPNLRDLVPDLDPLFIKHTAVKPYLLRHDSDDRRPPTRELRQLPEEMKDYFQFSYCIKCGLCVSACPTAASDRNFLGPQALAQAYRYTADSRDEGFRERREVLDRAHGPFRCHFAGACSEACPKGVDPALGIQLLKRYLVLWTLGFHRRKKGAPEMEPLEAKPRPDIPKAPEPTV